MVAQKQPGRPASWSGSSRKAKIETDYREALRSAGRHRDHSQLHIRPRGGVELGDGGSENCPLALGGGLGRERAPGKAARLPSMLTDHDSTAVLLSQWACSNAKWTSPMPLNLD